MHMKYFFFFLPGLVIFVTRRNQTGHEFYKTHQFAVCSVSPLSKELLNSLSEVLSRKNVGGCGKGGNGKEFLAFL